MVQFNFGNGKFMKLFPLVGVVLGLIHVQGVKGGKEYYGKLVGQLTTYAHKVSGKVFVVDDDTLFIKDFTYDGLGPDAYFWIGTTPEPAPTGTMVRYPDSSISKTEGDGPVLPAFEKGDVVLHLPMKVKEIRWLSVWCRRFTVNFGDVKFNRNLVIPQRKVLPEFKRLAHGLKSGNITILDSRTFYIPNLYYDGAGPDAYFWVGTGPEPHSGGTKVPNELGSLDVLHGYQGEDITITLPNDKTVYDIDWLAMWCVRYKHNFGHVLIPKKDLIVPPYIDLKKMESQSKPTIKFDNCINMLNGNAQLMWELDRNMPGYIKFQLSGRINDNQWVGLGFSRVPRTEMIGADAIIAYLTKRGSRQEFHAVDHYLSAKAQCDNSNGVCPDKVLNGYDNVTLLEGSRKNGVTTVVFRRPLKAVDTAQNLDVSLDRENVNIFAAIGPLNANKDRAHAHQSDQNGRTGRDESIVINPKGTGRHECLTILAESVGGGEAKPTPWPQMIIEGVKNFSARIGPTGGDKGYTPITGNPSWGIAWYINDQLIPEIYVERGQTYTFWTEGGEDETNPARYHPFYITDSSEGGYSQKTTEERRRQTIYAGVQFDKNGEPTPTGVGRYCEWEHMTIDKAKDSATFQDYKKTLKLECEEGRPGKVVWTVEKDTPDLLYYQCYTHNNLGWKIHVVDSGFRIPRDALNSGVLRKMGSTLSVLLPIISSYFVIKAAII